MLIVLILVVILFLLKFSNVSSYIAGIYYAIEFYYQPYKLLKRETKKQGSVVTLPILFTTWHFFTSDTIHKYFSLNNHESSDALAFRLKVPHLRFKNITVDNLREKTGISKFAIMCRINQTTKEYLSKLVKKHLAILNKTTEIKDLQRFCFDVTAAVMMEWLFQDKSSIFTKEFYECFYYYSEKFHPLTLYTGLPKKELRKYHDYMKSFCYKLYDSYRNENRTKIRALHDQLLQSNSMVKLDPNLNLFDFYLAGVFEKKTRSISRDDFVFLVNSTLWAAIFYPSEYLLLGLIKSIQLKTSNYEGIVKEIARMYPHMGIPKTLIKNVTYNGTEMKTGDIICFSPYFHHLDDRYYEKASEFNVERWISNPSLKLYTGMKGGWACPAINFTIKYVAAMLEEFNNYNLHLNSTVDQPNYNFGLLHYKDLINLKLNNSKAYKLTEIHTWENSTPNPKSRTVQPLWIFRHLQDAETAKRYLEEKFLSFYDSEEIKKHTYTIEIVEMNNVVDSYGLSDISDIIIN